MRIIKAREVLCMSFKKSKHIVLKQSEYKGIYATRVVYVIQKK